VGYKQYVVKELDWVAMRSNTDGYQPKFLVENNTKFIKVQCTLSGTLRDDWRVEDIASRICSQLSMYAVRQMPCSVVIQSKKGVGRKRLGVISDNFEQLGYSFISFNRLLEFYDAGSLVANFDKLDARAKLSTLISVTSQLSGLPLSSVMRYFFDMLTVDLLVLNQDRHFSNFGVFMNNISMSYEIAMLFDFGMGLFENDTMFDKLFSLDDCMRYSYIAPYEEDPFELLDVLKQIDQYRNYLRGLNISRLILNKKLFIHECAYEYFLKMKRSMCNV